ncbi:single-stranded DNA-binding protein [Gimesia aquarii]|uniref:Single-stranded DNA-binding protein n=1 Tax=Gimesia aquarii TaxID=2527964 RepID=A0A517X236_9PLAN|nr:single-stranded DNA-binding protein [Gimesia aquarii]QDU11565.1 Single-stranded DNA-binding protein [Gimesia aquarii]
MASFNKVILVGNLTRDPQVRYTPGGSAVAEVGLAVNRSWFDKNSNSRKEETTFVDVTLWGRTAEVASEYLTKGRSVLIEGRLQLDQWDDKESGQKRSKLKVVGENMTMLGGRGESGGGGGGRSGGGHASGGNTPAQGGAANAADSFYDDAPSGGGMPDDDVPF